MDKALWNSDRDSVATPERHTAKRLDWRRKISDNVAYALLVYTGLQIVVTMGALKGTTQSILPYFGLIVLVAAIIPGCRLFERRWEAMSDDEAADPELAGLYKRDRILIWIAAIGLPFVITGLFKGIALIL